MIEILNVKPEKKTLVNNVINALDQLKKEYPETEIYIEVPGNVVQCKIGDAIIFEAVQSSEPVIAIYVE